MGFHLLFAHSPLQHGLRGDGPVLQHSERGQLHHKDVATLCAEVQHLP